MTGESHPRIRPGKPSDAQGVLACLAILSHEAYLQRLQRMTILVAEIPLPEVIGTIAYAVVAEGHGHLRGMAVRPDHQGQKKLA